DDASFPARWRARFDRPAERAPRWPSWIVTPLVIASVVLACVSSTRRLGSSFPWPRAVLRAHAAVAPFESFNAYGLFAVMTTQRHEIVFEGSDDGIEWKPYVMKWQPGPTDRR